MSLIIFAVLIVCMTAMASSLPQYNDYDDGFGGGFGGGYRDAVGGGYGRTSEVDTIQQLPFGGFIEEDVITKRLPGGGFETDDRIIERLPFGLGTFEQDTITRNGGGRGRFF